MMARSKLNSISTKISKNAEQFIGIIGSPNILEQIEPVFWLGYQNAELIEKLLQARHDSSIAACDVIERLWKIAGELDKRADKTYQHSYTVLLLWVAYDAVHAKLIGVDAWGDFLKCAYRDGAFQNLDEDDQYTLLVDFRKAWEGGDFEYFFEELQRNLAEETD